MISLSSGCQKVKLKEPTFKLQDYVNLNELKLLYFTFSGAEADPSQTHQ